MVTAKIKISVNGAAIFSRRQLPPGFEGRLRSPQNTPLGNHAPQRSNSLLVHFPHASRGRHRVRGGGAAVPTFYVNTAAAKLNTYRSPMVVNRTKCDATRAESNSEILMDRYHLRFVESLVRRWGVWQVTPCCDLVQSSGLFAPLRNREASACGGGRKLKATVSTGSVFPHPRKNSSLQARVRRYVKVFNLHWLLIVSCTRRRNEPG